eukprot:TRINITY_DN43592_c0_g1_i1.p1 TRINITY_DN43592_c0_g1~~TRINITY_DN43592_c0_g1_i1.p1  ORF type:complete len:113 (-),score=1.31 TRINITY_DN43592_c0_g1_i1:310-648(-)
MGSVTQDVGNICRCICGSVAAAIPKNTTLLIPSENGCRDCTTDVCVQHFAECVTADKRGGAITVHCIDRTSLSSQMAIVSLFVMVSLMVLVALLKDKSRIMRRLYELGRHDA